MKCLRLGTDCLLGFKDKCHFDLPLSFGYIPLARQALKIHQRWIVKRSTSCCMSADPIPSVPPDLNGSM